MSWLKVKKTVFKHWPILVLFFVVLVFFWKFFLKGWLPIPADTIVGMYHPWRDVVWDNLTAGVPFKNFLITDPVRQQYPWRQLVIEQFKEGRLPSWNPYSLTGMPLLANLQSAPFYIFNLLFFLFNFNFSWGIMIFFQPLLAGIFLYFYLNHLKLQKSASFLGGLSLAFSGFFVVWLEWGTVLHSALWLPLILLAIDKVLAKKKLWPWGLVFSFSLSQSFFAGHLQTFFYVFLFSFIYWLWRLFQIKKGRRSLILIFGLCFFVFALITLPQWRPTLQLIKLSAREFDHPDWQKPGWFLPWSHLVQFLAPDFFGNPTTLNYQGVWNYAELVGFIGVIPLLLAGLAILKGLFKKVKTKEVKFFALAGLISLSFALPTPWAKLIYQFQLPFLATSQPTRLLFLVIFCLAVLAAWGLDFLLKAKKRIFPFLWLGVYGFLWFFVLSKGLAVSRRNLILPTAMLLAGIALIWFISSRSKKFLAKLALILLLTLVVFDLLRFGWKFTPFVKKDWLFPSTKTIEFLKKDQEAFRLMTVDNRLLPPNFGLAYQFQSLDGYDPLYLLRYGELVAAMERREANIKPPFGFNRIITPQNYQSKIADLLNVKYVLALSDLEHPKLDLVFQEGETRVYQNNRVLPRAFLVYDFQLATDKQAAIEFLFAEENDLSQTVVLEGELPAELREIGLREGNLKKGQGQAVIESYQANRVQLKVTSSQKAILVFTDAFYPGWQAFVNRQETEIYRADYHFRAIIVPEGEHQIIFQYGD